MNKYWCVINWRNGGKPTVTHNTETAANAEAERLAALNPGEHFTVFEAKTRYSTSIPIQLHVGCEVLK